MKKTSLFLCIYHFHFIISTILSLTQTRNLEHPLYFSHQITNYKCNSGATNIFECFQLLSPTTLNFEIDSTNQSTLHFPVSSPHPPKAALSSHSFVWTLWPAHGSGSLSPVRLFKMLPPDWLHSARIMLITRHYLILKSRWIYSLLNFHPVYSLTGPSTSKSP